MPDTTPDPLDCPADDGDSLGPISAPQMTYAAALRCAERRLGDPAAPGPLGWAAARARDEAEQIPADALAALHVAGFSEWQIPAREGGQLSSFEQLVALARAVARRDPAVALLAGKQAWSQLIWMAGSDRQRARVRFILRGGGRLAFAISEPSHGADLLANEVEAQPRPDGGFTVRGVKGPIGAPTLARSALVLARTEPAPGPRALSFVWVDRDRLQGGAVRALPRRATHGMRAAELGGLAFDDAVVGPEALIGARGAGLELVLRLFQVTRTLVPALGLGVADTGLRIAATFARQRRLYRGVTADLPVVDAGLLEAFGDLLAAEALTVSAARALHVDPAGASVTSAVAKVAGPALTGRALDRAAEILGANFYLRDGFGFGLMQKLLRDHAVLPLFDGSAAVCRHGLSGQLAQLRQPGVRADAARLRARFAATPPPAFAPERLSLSARGADDVVRGLDRHWSAALAHPAARCRAALASFDADLAAARQRERAARTVCLAHLADRYAHIHAAACGLHRAAAGGRPGGMSPGAFAALVVHRALDPHRPLVLGLEPAALAEARAALNAGLDGPRLLGIEPASLPDSTVHPEDPR